MKTVSKIENYVTSTSKVAWNALTEEGIDTAGIFVKILRFDERQQRPPSILLKFEAGAKYPYHNHPGGEEIFVIDGSCIIGETTLNQGDYLYTPPNFKHSVKSETGCTLLLVIPYEVEIINEK